MITFVEFLRKIARHLGIAVSQSILTVISFTCFFTVMTQQWPIMISLLLMVVIMSILIGIMYFVIKSCE